MWASPGFWIRICDKIYNDIGGHLIFTLWAYSFVWSAQVWQVQCSSFMQHDILEWQFDMIFQQFHMKIQNATISQQKAKEHGGMKPSISNKNKFMDSHVRLSTISNTPSQWLCERLWVQEESSTTDEAPMFAKGILCEWFSQCISNLIIDAYG